MMKAGFTNVGDLMDDLEAEIAAVKSGELSESKARLVAKGRGLQLRAVHLILQAARMESSYRPKAQAILGLIPSADGAAENSADSASVATKNNGGNAPDAASHTKKDPQTYTSDPKP